MPDMCMASTTRSPETDQGGRECVLLVDWIMLQPACSNCNWGYSKNNSSNRSWTAWKSWLLRWDIY